MSRYEHLYTLLCSPSLLRPDDIDLVECDSNGTLLRRPEIDQPDEPAAYTVSMDPAAQTLNVLDSLSSSTLVTVQSVVANKLRSIQLHNPEEVIELKNKTLISFDWSFKWQDMKFSWNRSRDALSARDDGYTLSARRKPDPDIMLCVYKQTKRGTLVQFLDYNLNRFEYEDRKGFETVAIASLFSLINAVKLDDINRALNQLDNNPFRASPVTPQPPIPDEVETGDPNEIIVSDHLSESAYVDHCLHLLSDPNLIYLSLCASTPSTVSRAISIASEVKRKRMKESVEREEVQQYVDYPGRGQPATSNISGARRNSGGTREREQIATPSEIKIYLSRIPLEELVPKKSNERKGTGPYPSEKAGVAKASTLSPPQIPNRVQKIPPPPLPPKKLSNTSAGRDEAESSSRMRTFWQKVTS